MTMTETEMAKELGYDRIWDCGLINMFIEILIMLKKNSF